MKFLTKQNNKYKILIMGIDFNHIRQVEDYPAFLCRDSSEHSGFDKVCNLSDCYQARPLIEIDGFYEFDLIKITNNNRQSYHLIIHKIIKTRLLFDTLPVCCYSSLDLQAKNLGSIFTPENQTKYPELHQRAIKITDEYFNQLLIN